MTLFLYQSIHCLLICIPIPGDLKSRRSIYCAHPCSIFYNIRSERQLMEQLNYNLLFRWFVGLSMDNPVWEHPVFSKNRDRLLNTGVASSFFSSVRDIAQQKVLISDKHFKVDGTLLEAWASMKRFQSTDHNDLRPLNGGGQTPEINFRGQKRTNDSHASITDPNAHL